MSKPINISRKGTRKKPKMNLDPMVREKRCPACDRKFASRTGLKRHIDAGHLPLEK